MDSGINAVYTTPPSVLSTDAVNFKLYWHDDENDYAAASMRDISRKNTRVGVAAIRSQSRESRDTERRR